MEKVEHNGFWWSQSDPNRRVEILRHCMFCCEKERQMTTHYLGGEWFSAPAHRIKVYKDILKHCGKITMAQFGLCNLIAREICIKERFISPEEPTNIIKVYFVEFEKHRPESEFGSDSGYWWPKDDLEIRPKILKQCIEDCKLEIKQMSK